jgi:hypothetical protein
METNHTPGPWGAEKYTCHAQTTVISADGIVIAETTGFGRLADDCIANARLIAAAPELLEAAKEMADLLDNLLRIGAINPDLIIAESIRNVLPIHRAAIAKATGSRQ